MINAIQNNVNFNGFYSLKNTNFTDSQNRVIDDIKYALGDEIIEKEDFIVFPGAIADTVELVHYVTGLKTQGAGINERVVFHRGSDKLVGIYDETHPFNLNDLDGSDYWAETKSRRSDNTWKFVGATIIALGALLIGNGAVKKFFANPYRANIEKVAPAVNDSLNAIKKDSLNLFM